LKRSSTLSSHGLEFPALVTRTMCQIAPTILPFSMKWVRDGQCITQSCSNSSFLTWEQSGLTLKRPITPSLSTLKYDWLTYWFNFRLDKTLVGYSFLSIIGGSGNIDRSNIEVISQILKVANGGNARKTRIRYKALLGYNQLKEHLVLLTWNGLTSLRRKYRNI
jgi:hypothetical protein